MDNQLKITIDQLKNYLGKGLIMLRPDRRTKLPIQGIELPNTLIFDDNGEWKYGDISKNRPICYRLSDLDKLIPELGFVPIDYFLGDDVDLVLNAVQVNDLSYLPFNLISLLFHWHFWPFGEEYFEEGLVIDKLKQQ